MLVSGFHASAVKSGGRSLGTTDRQVKGRKATARSEARAEGSRRHVRYPDAAHDEMSKR